MLLLLSKTVRVSPELIQLEMQFRSPVPLGRRRLNVGLHHARPACGTLSGAGSGLSVGGWSGTVRMAQAISRDGADGSGMWGLFNIFISSLSRLMTCLEVQCPHLFLNTFAPIVEV